MTVIKYVFSIIGGVIAYWLGGIDTLIICLAGMIAIDYLTGVLSAIYNKNLSSDIGFKGITKKVCILLIVALAYIIEKATGGAFAIREIVIIFFIVNEGISLLENASKMGIPIPTKLTNILEQIRTQTEENNNGN